MKPKPWRLAAWAGFALSAGFALHDEWKLPELCWSFWLTGLFYCWAFVLVGGLRILLIPAETIPVRIRQWPALATVPVVAWRGAIALLAVGIALVMFHLYAWLFGFYGLFLSVFAEMEPQVLFGRNGFINSDFFTPVAHLLERYWPMVLGAIATDIHLAMTGSPWRVPFKPFSLQLVLIHLMVLGVPFVSLIFWWLMGERYHAPAVVLVLALFYFFPRQESPKPRTEGCPP
jgi:hypothetical protein